jgi:hypothetical protein
MLFFRLAAYVTEVSRIKITKGSPIRKQPVKCSSTVQEKEETLCAAEDVVFWISDAFLQ